ncbi:MAG: cupin domain-containing protein [Actinomycetota bacterium]
MTDISVTHADDRIVSEADATSGMVRETAVDAENAWVGVVRTAPQRPSGWHHHGEYDTYAYVLSGGIEFEFGPGGSKRVEAGPGDFVHVPAGVIHREVNPTKEEGSLVLVRVGSGPPVINVDGPAE